MYTVRRAESVFVYVKLIAVLDLFVYLIRSSRATRSFKMSFVYDFMFLVLSRVSLITFVSLLMRSTSSLTSASLSLCLSYKSRLL